METVFHREDTFFDVPEYCFDHDPNIYGCVANYPTLRGMKQQQYLLVSLTELHLVGWLPLSVSHVVASRPWRGWIQVEDFFVHMPGARCWFWAGASAILLAGTPPCGFPLRPGIQHGSWTPRASVPRASLDWCCILFYDVALDVM